MQVNSSRQIGSSSPSRYFSFDPSHDTARASINLSIQSSPAPKNQLLATGYVSATITHKKGGQPINQKDSNGRLYI